jgi:mono/diheme cytochrome c family protein
MNSDKNNLQNTNLPEDEIKFKQLVKNPLRLFGWFFAFALVIIIALGVYFVKNLNTISFNEQEVGLPDSTNIKTEIALKKGGLMPAIDLKQIKSPSLEFIAKGKEIYTNTCKTCHGDNGMGDGVGGAALNPKPRNFCETNGWKNGRGIDEMYKTLQEGIKGSGMTAYEFLPPSDRFAVISFVRTFAAFPEVTDAQLASLDAAYKLSTGTLVPNTIPVGKAEKLAVTENAEQKEILSRFVAVVNSSNDSNAEHLKALALDLQKVGTVFIRSSSKQKYETFMEAVIANPVGSGFKPAAAVLSKDEWKSLCKYLKSTMM